jgi:peptide-methionine (R)-S-oxide reductase
MTMVTRRLVVAGGLCGGAAALAAAFGSSESGSAGSFEVAHDDPEWRQRLSKDQYRVLRRSGTELPYTSSLLDEHRRGVFTCAGCDLAAFSSDTKFDSGTGWPSFWAALDGAVVEDSDRSFGVLRTAVACRRCGGHLGHVFADGPKPTGLRYCMNGVALGFTPMAA